MTSATPRWPSSLPDYWLVDGFGETPRMPKVSFQSDVGPAIERRKGTMKMTEFTCSAIFDDDQVETLERFVGVDLAHATRSFQAPHPRTRDSCIMRLIGERPYSIRPHLLVWQVSFTLLVIA